MKISAESRVQRFEIIVPGKLGFHLRLVARFVALIQKFRSEIIIRKGELRADGKSILELLTLGAGWKSKLEIKVIGNDAALARESIQDFFLDQEDQYGSDDSVQRKA